MNKLPKPVYLNVCPSCGGEVYDRTETKNTIFKCHNKSCNSIFFKPVNVLYIDEPRTLWVSEIEKFVDKDKYVFHYFIISKELVNKLGWEPIVDMKTTVAIIDKFIDIGSADMVKTLIPINKTLASTIRELNKLKNKLSSMESISYTDLPDWLGVCCYATPDKFINLLVSVNNFRLANLGNATKHKVANNEFLDVEIVSLIKYVTGNYNRYSEHGDVTEITSEYISKKTCEDIETEIKHFKNT